MVSCYRGRTGVDVSHLIRVIIPKQYKIDIREASLVELIANALDAKPSQIHINVDPDKGLMTVEDDGKGMGREKFRSEYHDITPSKTIGTGIGFAGQGAKLALNFCEKIVTETWSQMYKGFSEWRLQEKNAPYEIYDEQVRTLTHPGTKVSLFLNEDNKTFYTSDLVEKILIKHYQPLLYEEPFKAYTGGSPVLIEGRGQYPVRVSHRIYNPSLKFLINGKLVSKKQLTPTLEKQKEVLVTLQRKNRVPALFGLLKVPVTEDMQGVAICTFGKVIERTWFRKEPPEKERIVGWVEASKLITAVTTDKCSFQQGNKLYEGFFRNAQAKFAEWLDEIGLGEKLLAKRADLSNLEREINSILRGIPDLSFFAAEVERTVAIPDAQGEPRELATGTQVTAGTRKGNGVGKGVKVYPGNERGKAPTGAPGVDVSATDHQRSLRGGIRLATEERPDSDKEARFDGETVIVNVSHPAYRRAEREKSLNYHIVKSVALSLLEYDIEKSPELNLKKTFDLQAKFFKLWGEQ